MSDSENRKLTPVGFAPFEEPRDTVQSSGMPEEDAVAVAVEPDDRGTLAGFEAALDELEKDFEQKALELKQSLDLNHHETKLLLNGLKTKIIEWYQGTKSLLETHTARLDAQAKAIRWLATEDKVRRGREQLPPLDCPIDDL